jgi:MYXO-CTERM domain-containing protein
MTGRGLVRWLLFAGRMRLVLIALVALVASTAEAVASPACSGPWIVTYRSPVGCPLILVERDASALPPTVEVWRDGQLVTDATAQVVTTPIHLDVEYWGVDCDSSSRIQYVQAEPSVHHSIELTGTQAGDQVLLDGYAAAEIEIPATCYVVDLPHPECYATQSTECPMPEEPAEDLDIDVGCSASHGSAGLPLLLALGAIVRRRRRR